MLIKEQENRGSKHPHVHSNPVGLLAESRRNVCMCSHDCCTNDIVAPYIFPNLTGYEPA